MTIPTPTAQRLQTAPRRTHYSIWIAAPTGERLALVESFVRLEYRRAICGSGDGSPAQRNNRLTLLLLDNGRYDTMLQCDYRLEVWRSAQGTLPVLETETVWFISRVERRTMRGGPRVVEVEAIPAVLLLQRRVIGLQETLANTTPAPLTAPADDLMKAIVRRTFGAEAGSERDVGKWLSIAADAGVCPSLTKAINLRSVFDLLQEVAEASAQNGTPLFFDVVAPTPTTLRFETYPYIRGAERTMMVLSAETNSIATVSRVVDWGEMATHVVVTNTDGSQAVVVGDEMNAGRVPFGRREWAATPASGTYVGLEAGTAALSAEGAALLQHLQPQHTLHATVTSHPEAAYGSHWQLGDRVTVAVGQEGMSCIVQSISVVLEAGEEVIKANVVNSERITT
jgi:hypothetical protein